MNFTSKRTVLSLASAVAVGVALMVVPLVFYWWNFPGPLSTEQGVWGQFGDFFGGTLNPIFGFLSFVILIAALLLQGHELRLSTHELAASANALKKQSDALDKQNFEQTFFQMLQRFSQVVDAVTYVNTASGRKSFSHLYMRLRTDLDRHKEQPFQIQVERAYAAFHDSWRTELDHYFRTLYHIFKFVDSSRLDDKEKAEYANVARAQLSTYELALLFYNGAWGEGKEGFKPLIEKYGLLKHVNAKDLFDAKHREPGVFYRASAFQSYDERCKG